MKLLPGLVSTGVWAGFVGSKVEAGGSLRLAEGGGCKSIGIDPRFWDKRNAFTSTSAQHLNF